MLLYARYHGDWDGHYQSYRWQKLGDAARQCRLPVPKDLHRARADAELMRCFVRHMTGRAPKVPNTRPSLLSLQKKGSP